MPSTCARSATTSRSPMRSATSARPSRRWRRCRTRRTASPTPPMPPAHRSIAYAFSRGPLCYYEQIPDAQRDQRAPGQARGRLQDGVTRFPDTAYARDARLKIDLGRDHLAGKEMNVGRFYQRQRLYAAAIGRFRRVVEEYQTTNHVPEALHRLTEIYLALGLTEEARKTASVLGHNFPGSPWYQDSYALLVEGTQPAEQDRPGLLRRAWNAVF